jgi:TfoX/Sxy family transcriptional regulator of competence genes
MEWSRRITVGTSLDTIHFICDQAGLSTRLTFRKMFGEYALYLDGKVVALVCDDQLFLKPTPEGRAHLGEVTEGFPFPGARAFFLLSAELDDPERLREALQITARALPEPKPRRVKRAAKKTKRTIASRQQEPR